MEAQQTIVMTGASGGIGRVAARHLAASEVPTHVVLLSRGSSAEQVAELRAAGASVIAVRADLASLQSVQDAADEVTSRVRAGELPPIAAVACNAGVQHTNALTRTVDGFESSFAVNVLANHVLLRGLENDLGPAARIVVTVSDTHFGDFRHNLGLVPGPQWRPVETLAYPGAFAKPATTAAGRTAYSTSKLAAIYLVHEYARRHPDGRSIYSYNPALVPGTGLARNADAFSRFAMRWILPVMTLTPLATTPEVAGRRLADAVSGRVAAPCGAYIDRDRVAPSSAESFCLPREREVWEAVETLTERFRGR